MAKSPATLDKQIEKVNKELERLELATVNGADERALVDSACDQMGISGVLQQVSLLFTILIAFFAGLGSSVGFGSITVGALIAVAMVAVATLVCVGLMGAQQSAKAVELIVMYRSNRSLPSQR